MDAVQLEFGAALRRLPDARAMVAAAVGDAIVGTLNPMRGVLQLVGEARGWSTHDCTRAERKLLACGVADVAKLGEAVRAGVLNDLLASRGQKLFSDDALALMMRLLGHEYK